MLFHLLSTTLHSFCIPEVFWNKYIVKLFWKFPLTCHSGKPCQQNFKSIFTDFSFLNFSLIVLLWYRYGISELQFYDKINWSVTYYLGDLKNLMELNLFLTTGFFLYLSFYISLLHKKRYHQIFESRKRVSWVRKKISNWSTVG